MSEKTENEKQEEREKKRPVYGDYRDVIDMFRPIILNDDEKIKKFYEEYGKGDD